MLSKFIKINNTCIYVILMLALISCSKDSSKLNNYNRIKIEVPEISTVLQHINIQYELSDVIYLSCPQDLGDISGTPIFCNNRIYAYDSQRRFVMVFDKNGNYLFRVGGLGHASNEIIGQISSFDVNTSTNYIHIFNREGYKIIIYDNNGKFVNTIHLNDCLPISLKLLKDNNYIASNSCISSKNRNSQLLKMDGNGEKFQVLLEDNKENRLTCEGISTAPLYSDGNNLITYLPIMSDSLIVLESDTIKHVIKFNFADGFPSEKMINQAKENGKLEIDNDIEYISKAQVNNHYVLMEFYASKKGKGYSENYTLLYDRKKHKCYLQRGCFELPKMIGRVITICDNNLIVLISSDDVNIIKSCYEQCSDKDNLSFSEYLETNYGHEVSNIFKNGWNGNSIILKIKLK